MRYLSAITMLILALAIMPPVNAQSFKPDYKAGNAAYMKGDYATALRHWRPVALQGNASAAYLLGVMYQNSEGLLQDRVMAYVWYNIAAARGHSFSRGEREKIRKTLTASEFKLGRKLSKLCFRKPARCPEYSDD